MLLRKLFHLLNASNGLRRLAVLGHSRNNCLATSSPHEVTPMTTLALRRPMYVPLTRSLWPEVSPALHVFGRKGRRGGVNSIPSTCCRRGAFMLACSFYVAPYQACIAFCITRSYNKRVLGPKASSQPPKPRVLKKCRVLRGDNHLGAQKTHPGLARQLKAQNTGSTAEPVNFRSVVEVHRRAHSPQNTFLRKHHHPYRPWRSST